MPRNRSRENQLIESARDGDVGALTKALKGARNLESTDSSGFTALYCAANNGHARCVNALLKAGAAIDAQDSNGITPAMRAACWSHPKTLSILLDAGANTHIKARNGNTVAMWAVFKGNKDCAMIVSLHDASLLDHPDDYGTTPLSISRKNGWADVVAVAEKEILTRNLSRPRHSWSGLGL